MYSRYPNRRPLSTGQFLRNIQFSEHAHASRGGGVGQPGCLGRLPQRGDRAFTQHGVDAQRGIRCATSEADSRLVGLEEVQLTASGRLRGFRRKTHTFKEERQPCLPITSRRTASRRS